MRFLALLLAFFVSPAFAVVSVTTGAGGTKTIAFPSNTIGGSTTYYTVPTGGALVTPTPTNSSGWYPAGNYGVTPAATGVTVGGEVSNPLGNGRNLPVSVRAPVSKADTAKAIGNFARGVGGAALKTVGAVYAVGEIAKSLNDLCNDLGYSCYKGTSGQTEVMKSNQSTDLCYTQPCYKWPLQAGGYTENKQTAADSACGFMLYPYISCTYTLGGSGNSVMTIKACQTATYCSTTTRQGVGGGATQTASMSPSTLQDLENKIASESGWPSSQNVEKTLAEAMKQGVPVTVGTPTVSGPASVAGPTTTSTTPAQNGQPAKTTTTSTTYNTTYNNNTYTTTVNTTTSVNNGGTVTNTTDTKEAEETSPTDTALPEVPKLYTPKYLDGIKGVWDTQIGKVKSSKIGQLTSSLVPTFPETGTCPVWSVSSDFGALGNFGTGNVAPPCWIWPIAKIFTIIGALFLARALIFGG